MSLVVPKDLKAALQKLAEKNRRKLSDFVRLQLEDAVVAEAAADVGSKPKDAAPSPPVGIRIRGDKTYPKRGTNRPPPPVAGAG